MHNDATFSDRDFQNVIRIGQAGKLENLLTTGRFGLASTRCTTSPTCRSARKSARAERERAARARARAPHARERRAREKARARPETCADRARARAPTIFHLLPPPPPPPPLRAQFESREHLVMFDPHASTLPGATVSQPGLKIRFVGSELLRHFPDQFAPFLLFGCDLTRPYEGTCFRFPLRDAQRARDSEISGARYDRAGVLALLEQFRASAQRFLLFLRHVRRIEVLVLEEGMDAPETLYAAAVTRRGGGGGENGWQAISEFISGPPARPLSKEAFYATLARTPEDRLPAVCQTVEITCESGGGDARGRARARAAPAAAPAAISTARSRRRRRRRARARLTRGPRRPRRAARRSTSTSRAGGGRATWRSTRRTRR